MMARKKAVQQTAEKNDRPWPASEVHIVDIAKLVPYARNARTHTPNQIAQIAESIKRFGFTIPVLVAEDRTIIAGHGRVLAAKELGLAEVPVMIAIGWTDAERRAYTIADNQIALNAGWDQDILIAELTDLGGFGFDPGSIGFSPEQFSALGLPGGNSGNGLQDTSTPGSLSASFGVVPFSVLSARDGWWQDRKAAWIALGIQSEEGREVDLLNLAASVKRQQAYTEIRKSKQSKRAAQ